MLLELHPAHVVYIFSRTSILSLIIELIKADLMWLQLLLIGSDIQLRILLI